MLAGLFILSGAIGGLGWYNLRIEKSKNEQLRAQLAKATSDANGPQFPEPATVVTPTTIGMVPSPPTSNIASTAIPGMEAATSRNEIAQEFQYRMAQLAQQRLRMQKNFPGVVEAMELSEYEADQLLDFLAEDQKKLGTQLAAVGHNGTMDTATAEVLSNHDQQQDVEIANLLGAGKVAKWQEYRQSRTARMQSTTLATELAQLGLPLTADQQRSLTSALIVEQNRWMKEEASLASNAGSGDGSREQGIRQMNDSNRRILNAAAPSLNAEQLAVLRRKFDSQSSLNGGQTGGR